MSGKRCQRCKSYVRLHQDDGQCPDYAEADLRKYWEGEVVVVATERFKLEQMVGNSCGTPWLEHEPRWQLACRNLFRVRFGLMPWNLEQNADSKKRPKACWAMRAWSAPGDPLSEYRYKSCKLGMDHDEGHEFL